MRATLIILCTLLYTATLSSQALPRGLSAEEKLMIQRGEVPGSIEMPNALASGAVSTPRSTGEWERLQAIAITWTNYRSILTEIVRHAVEEVEVIIVTRNEAATRFYLENAGVDPDSNIVYIDPQYNSVWIRDYGPNTAYTSDVDSLVLVDWIYNRPRPQDDVISGAIAEYLGTPLLATTAAPTDLVNTGGNYMSDGLGRGFSSKLVLEENGPGSIWGQSDHDEEDVDSIMFEFMGVEEYVKMETLPFDGIHHIDMHMKLLDETRLLVGEYPEGVADGPQIEANIQYVVENFKLATGRDYEVIRIPMPPDQFGRYPNTGGYYRTYTNALFINKTILVPTYEEEYDTTALRIWKEAMPGYKIVGIDCNDIIPAGGAIHCITKEIGVDGPLWISHESPTTAPSEEPIALTALAKHRSGIGDMKLYARTGNSDFIEIDMYGEGDDLYTGVFDRFDPLDTVYYYFEATSADGLTEKRPMVAPEGTFRVVIDEATTSTRDASRETDVKIYPNPASAITCIELNLDRSEDVRVVLYDMQGRLVDVLFDGYLESGVRRVFFDAQNFLPGKYIMKLTSTMRSESHPVIVVNK